MFDPEKFGQAMGEAIRKAVEPLHQEIARLKSVIDAAPQPVAGNDGADGKDGVDGKDCDMEAVKALVVELVKAIPMPADGKDGKDGNDGKNGDKGDAGEKGADGLGVADLLIDREGNLVATMTDGRMKSLGVIVGKDGNNGVDGKDGIGFDAFDIEYIEETHEIAIKASAAGRTKELRYPAGGIRPAGYWREGTKAKAGEAWVQGGSLWIAMKATETKPATGDAWIIAARAGKDGERGQKGADAEPPKPISLGSKQ